MGKLIHELLRELTAESKVMTALKTLFITVAAFQMTVRRGKQLKPYNISGLPPLRNSKQ